MSDHGVEIVQDWDGWFVATCQCGWVSPPCPGKGEAADSYGDHRALSASQGQGS